MESVGSSIILISPLVYGKYSAVSATINVDKYEYKSLLNLS